MSDNSPNASKQKRQRQWPNWSKSEIEAIRYYLEERGNDCLLALSQCEKMDCVQLRKWVSKEREYWSQMYACIRWLLHHAPKTNTSKRKTQTNKRNN
jgi:hypothetical protein